MTHRHLLMSEARCLKFDHFPNVVVGPGSLGVFYGHAVGQQAHNASAIVSRILGQGDCIDLDSSAMGLSYYRDRGRGGRDGGPFFARGFGVHVDIGTRILAVLVVFPLAAKHGGMRCGGRRGQEAVHLAVEHQLGLELDAQQALDAAIDPSGIELITDRKISHVSICSPTQSSHLMTCAAGTYSTFLALYL